MTGTETIDANSSAFLEEVHNKYRSDIKAAIRMILNEKRSFMDASVDEEDIYSELLLALWRYAASFAKPGTASLKTRLCAFAKHHVINYHIKKQRRRFGIIQTNPFGRVGKYCEAFTPLELNSMRADELEANQQGRIEKVVKAHISRS